VSKLGKLLAKGASLGGRTASGPSNGDLESSKRGADGRLFHAGDTGNLLGWPQSCKKSFASFTIVSADGVAARLYSADGLAGTDASVFTRGREARKPTLELFRACWPGADVKSCNVECESANGIYTRASPLLDTRLALRDPD